MTKTIISDDSFNSKLSFVQDRIDRLRNEILYLQEFTTDSEDNTLRPVFDILDNLSLLTDDLQRS